MTRFLLLCCLSSVFCLGPGLRADVTIRYETNFKAQPGLPGMGNGGLAQLPAMMPSTIQLKGNKGSCLFGKVVFLEDFEKQEITLMDPANKKYATMPMQEYVSQIASTMPKMPEAAAKMMEAMKADVASRKTGQTDVIQGVEAEETELTFTVSMPGMAGADAGAMPSGPMVKYVMHLWTAKPDEAFHNEAIRQLTGHNMYMMQLLNPAGQMQKLFANMPSLGKAVENTWSEFSGGKQVVLKTHGEMFMPMMAMIAQQMSKNGQQGAASLDANAPLIETNTQVSEISTGTLDDAIFQLPAGYQTAPVSELIGQMIKAPASAVQ